MNLESSEIFLNSIGFESKSQSVFRHNPSGRLGTELSFIQLTSEDIKTGVTKAIACQDGWRKTGIVQRAKLLEKVVNNLIAKRDALVKAVQIETGKSLDLANAEFETAMEFLLSLAGASKFASGIVIPSTNPKKVCFSTREPLGLAALIVSFNTPLPNYAWKVGPSFLSGNISILKPSQYTPLSASLFVSSFQEEIPGFSPVLLLLGGPEQGRCLLREEIDLVSFTGSYEVGQDVKQIIANKNPKLILELGGNNPLIIFEDANLEKAAEAAITSAFSNAGQRCASARRILVEETVFQEFKSTLSRILQSSEIEDSGFESVGPVISDSSFDLAEQYIDSLSSSGIEYFQMSEPQKGLRYFPPTVVDLGKDNVSLADKEIFAPITHLMSFSSEHEAILMAGVTGYSLTAAVWTSDIGKALSVSKQLRVGLVNLNGPTHGAEFQFPFGGMGRSGNVTKEVGLQSLDQYSFTKLTTMVQN